MRVLIIHIEGNSFNNPSMKEIMNLLLEKGCKIDLRYAKSHIPMPQYAGIRYLPFGAMIRILKTIIFDLLCLRPLVLLSVIAEIYFCYRKYDLIIGVDRRGLIEASVINKFTGTPYAFISFEIMFEGETSVRYKSLEREASKGVTVWFVQDDFRAEQLQKENGLDPHKKMLLPVASAGIGRPNSVRLRDFLGVPIDKNVAIAIGSVFDWAMTRKILESVEGWPEDWVFVVHERYGRTSENLTEALAALRHLVGRKIFISDAATEDIGDLGGILSGVSVGLAFYEPTYKDSHSGNNLKYLGLSSGKISTYLRYGIPVVINEIGLYAKEARLHRFGFVVECPQQIRHKLDNCLDDQLKRNALDYFSRKLDFNLYRDRVWQSVSAVKPECC